MAKKLKTLKKHQFKHVQPTERMTSGSTAGATASVVNETGKNFDYVAADIKRLALTVSALLVVEFGLWFAMNNTGLGNFVYNLIKV